MLLTQTATCDAEHNRQLPTRYHASERKTWPHKSTVTYPSTYKRPDMPHMKATKSVLNLTVLASQVVAASRARTRDFQFLSQILGPNSCPEWNGFNSHLNRADGHTIITATTCVYTPLIDMKPSDPDTMLTAMVQAERLVKSTGQDIVGPFHIMCVTIWTLFSVNN